jgi:signal transduction histidine kinase
VLSRRADIKLFLTLGGFCLLLFVASILAALFLNELHRKITAVLNENVKSTEVAELLDEDIRELAQMLRSGTPTDEVERRNQTTREILAKAEDLANHPEEEVHVGRIADILDDYFRKWRVNHPDQAAPARANDSDLAVQLEQRVLPEVVALRKFNMRQIVASEEKNKAIVNPLLWGILGLGVGGSFFGMVLGYNMARRLRHSIGQLSISIRDAAGRLNRELGSVTLKEEGDLPALQLQMQGLIQEISRTVEQLQQREHEVLRAEQLAGVGKIAAGVAHELRNPLTAIKMLVQTGLEGHPPSGLTAEELAVIEQSVRRMEQYIQIFLDFARPPRAERRRIDLLEVVRRAAVLVEGRARRQKVDVGMHLPDEPLMACLDPEQIQQVLVNVLINALDSQPRGGAIEISVNRTNGKVEVEVSDQGPGLPAEVRGRLFEPFVTSKPDGVGLGLSICKRLIETNGGTIRIDNIPSGGAAVAFTVPVEEAVDAVAAGSR